jgi:hypothetical protein
MAAEAKRSNAVSKENGHDELAPSDFIIAASTLGGRLREAERKQQARAGEEAISSLARRFAPTPPEPETRAADDAPQTLRATPHLRRVPVETAGDEPPRAGLGPWLIAALILACAAPSGLAAFMMWNGSLPTPFASSPAPAPAISPVEPAEAPPLPVKSQDRMEAAVSASSDPETKTSVQSKTALVEPAEPVAPAEPAPPPPAFSKAEVEGAAPGAEADLRIEVEPAGALSDGSSIVIGNLPERAVLSSGQPVAEGWSVPAAGIDGLKLRLPEDAAGEATLLLTLKSPDGETLAETEARFEVGAAPILRPDYASRIESLMENGQKMIDVGYISGARAYYIRAAEAGSAEGAMAAAATFDPNALAALQAHGVKADVAQARRWYERALAMGAGDAEAKLGALPAR